MIKVGGKYVHLGTAWSTDQGRKGSYNLYYCVADTITGPYGPRKLPVDSLVTGHLSRI